MAGVEKKVEKKREGAARKKIGLALGGGGAKGLAHIGVIKALEAAGVPIDYIAGTSMGALVGGCYAATKDVKFLEDLFLNVRKEDVVSVSKMIRNHDGMFFRNKPITELLESHFKDVAIEHCVIPFKAVATDVKNGDEVILEKGSLVDAVRASTALPIVFKPVEVRGKLLMDGGFVNPVPADVVRNMGADFVIAVDVSSRWVNISEEPVHLTHLYSIIARALLVMEYQIARHTLEKADIVIRPAVMSFTWHSFGDAFEIIRRGEHALHAHLEEICGKTGCAIPRKTVLEKFFDFLFDFK